jgi:hypothetical protein
VRGPVGRPADLEGIPTRRCVLNQNRETMLLRRTAVVFALLVLPALVVPRLWCDRGGQALFEGRPGSAAPLAREVGAWMVAGVDADRFSTGSSRFDGEWALGTHQMALLGLGQTVLQHPDLREELTPAMDAGLTRLLEPSTRSFGTEAWGEDGLRALDSSSGHAYLGYLNLALGMHRLVTPDSDLAGLHDELTAALARRLSQAPHGTIETYPGETYPPDVCAVAGSIGLHARVTGTDHGEVLAAWAEAFREHHVDPDTGLLVQAVDGASGEPLDRARASGTAIGAYFLAFADPELSAGFHAALKDHCRVGVLGFGGMREFARGQGGGFGDVDSGPVVFGVGMSATGFALASARIHRDRATFRQLHRTAVLFGAPLERDGRRSFVTGGPLGNAILLAMLTAGPGTASWEGP